jgi:SAM-dependent methyltransferase
MNTVAGSGRSGGPDRGAELARRLRRLERVFAVPALRSERLGTRDVVTYYEQCFDAYRKYHSREGAVHMALNDGERFDPDGYYGQPRLIEQGFAGAPPRDVLELAFGQGFNLAYLAARHPQVRFHGVDLTPRHVRITRERTAALPNVGLVLGDMQALPLADASFDLVFCVEAFCYALDEARALAEAARVLRPGGRLVLFDGYLPRPAQAMSADEALAVDLVARGMALARFQVVGEFLAATRAAGFEVERMAALDAQILPSLARLERLTGAVIRWPWLGRRALARRSAARGRNVLAGYLMHCTMKQGLLTYRHLVLRKGPAA